MVRALVVGPLRKELFLWLPLGKQRMGLVNLVLELKVWGIFVTITNSPPPSTIIPSEIKVNIEGGIL